MMPAWPREVLQTAVSISSPSALVTRELVIAFCGLGLVALLPVVFKYFRKQASMTRPDFDIAVIGAGSGGLTVAAAAAQFGQRVVLFEKGEMGGDCLNYGCVPSKALLAAAKQAQALRSGAAYGIAAQEPQVDFAKVMAHVKRAIAAIAPNDSQERFEKLGVNVVRADAAFRDASTIEAAGQAYTARRMVIATGSRAALPPVPGLADVPYLTNENIFENQILPEHLLIIGGGPIGMEMAQAHRRLGSKVTVIEAFDPLAKDDPELTAIVLERLKAEGVTILARAAIASVKKVPDGIMIDIKDHGAITGSHLLVAAGRQPNIEGLNLEAAGIAYTKRGITVDHRPQDQQPRVYAVGDVAGGLQFTHVAGYHAGLVIRNALFGLAGQGQRRHPVGDLHRPGTGACRSHRGAGPQGSRRDDQGVALAVPRQ